MRNLFFLCVSVGVLATTSGCAVTSAAIKSDDGRTVARSIQDINAQRTIRARMTRAHGFKLSGVDVEVAEGVVVLSGRVPRVEDRIEAERISWSAPKIDEVGNELRIGDKQGLVRNGKDGLVEKSVRARLMADSGVRARNLSIETHEGIVYIMGLARDQKELDRAARIASTTRGVNEVVSYVRLQSGETSPVSQGYASQTAPSAPRASTEDFFPQAPAYRAPDETITSEPLDKIPDDEPFYRDPETGERIDLPPGTVVVPYQPDTPGSLGSGGKAPPTGAPFYIDPDSGKRIPVVYRN